MKITAIVVCVNYADMLEETIGSTMSQVDRLVVVSSTKDEAVAEVVEDAGADLVQSDAYLKPGPFSKGGMINAGLASIPREDWILLLDSDIILARNTREVFEAGQPDPCNLYFAQRRAVPDLPAWLRTPAALRPEPHTMNLIPEGDCNGLPIGYFQLFHAWAPALEDRTPPVVPLNGRPRIVSSIRPPRGVDGKIPEVESPTTHGSWPQLYDATYHKADWTDLVFLFRWKKEEWMPLPAPCGHIPHGMWGVNWKGRTSPPMSEIRGRGLDFGRQAGYITCIHNYGDEHAKSGRRSAGTGEPWKPDRTFYRDAPGCV